MSRTWSGTISLHSLLLALFAAGLLAAPAACVHTTKMRHYFGVVDVNKARPDVKFYRVSVTAKSFNKQCFFQTGFYDAEALHFLYGQVPAPKVRATPGARDVTPGPLQDQDATKLPQKPAGPVGVYTITYDPSEQRWKVVDPGQRFTYIYGAYADAVAQQIQSFSEAQETGQQLASLFAAAAGATAHEDAAAAKDRAAAAKKRASGLAASMRPLADKAGKADAKPDALSQVLLEAAQAAVRAAGSNADLGKDITPAFQKAQAVYDALSK